MRSRKSLFEIKDLKANVVFDRIRQRTPYPTAIRFTWSTLDSGMAVEETEVLLFLEKRDENKTRLHLVQDGLPNSTVSKSHIRGWSEALGQLSHQWK